MQESMKSYYQFCYQIEPPCALDYMVRVSPGNAMHCTWRQGGSLLPNESVMEYAAAACPISCKQ